MEPVYTNALVCSTLFDEFLGVKDRSSSDYLVAEELRGQFNQWAAYVGAFAAPRASLDARLGPYPSIRDMVVELLYAVRRNMQWGMDALSSALPISNGAKSVIDEDSNPEDPDALGLGAAGAAIGRLFILAVEIRRSARQSHRPRPGISPSMPDGSLCLLLLKSRYPNARGSLLDQVALSIRVRGASLQYLRLHNKKLAFRREVESARERSSKEPSEAKPITVAPTTTPEIKVDAAPQTAQSTADTMPSLVSPSAIIRYKEVNRRPTGSMISRGSAVRDSEGNDFPYPSMPKPKGGASYHSCTICADPLHTSTMSDQAWRSHVDQDLESYVCISEECLEPPRYFSHARDWMDHMQTKHNMDWAQRVHTEMWFCDLGHDPAVEFDEKKQFMEHLEQQHGKRLTPSQLQGRARRNRRIATRDPFICPFCDCVPPTIVDRLHEKPYNRFSEHIATHLKSVSFFSLSYIDDEDGESEDDESAQSASQSSGIKGARTARSISSDHIEAIRNAPDFLEDDQAKAEAVTLGYPGKVGGGDEQEEWAWFPRKELETDDEKLKD
ncbi:hypothetical protein GQ53DRAFT_639935, partial [Thozetella sp. PMI_491]